MYNIEITRQLGRLYIRATGFFSVEGAEEAVALITKEVRMMAPGFDLVTDMRDYKCSRPEVAQALSDLMQIYKAAGVRRIVRILGTSIPAKQQLERYSKQEGVHVINVFSLSEAETELAKRAVA